ncbi:MAG: GNAT family N-acetyltransferase [Acidimicrobiales bacterium]|nr:GNAT family N-acetyltransferase [Acidimicrobiales bacterium]
MLQFEVRDLDRAVALYRDGFGLELHVSDHEGGDHGADDRWISGRHAAITWQAVTSGARALSAPAGVFVLVRAGRTTVGCGGVQRFDADTGEIKRMWIDPEWRGQGLSKRLLADLEDRARQLGHRRVVLDTNAELTEALHLYASAGYAATEPYNDNAYAQRWFTKDL